MDNFAEFYTDIFVAINSVLASAYVADALLWILGISVGLIFIFFILSLLKNK